MPEGDVGAEEAPQVAEDYLQYLNDDDLALLGGEGDDEVSGNDEVRDYSAPHVRSVVPPGVDYDPIFSFEEASRHNIKFALEESLEPTAATLSELYFPDSMISDWAEASTKYAQSKKPGAPKIRPSDILHFLTIVMYMGVVRLPAKRDYWSTRKLMPSHEVCTAHGMTRSKFLYLYSNFHLVGPDGGSAEEEAICDDSDAEMETGENESGDVARAGSWYSKVEPFLKHILTVSRRICKHPSSCLSIDEMMARFKGRSTQTFRMKGKPIKEGYKFWALCDKSGFVYHMMPCTRVGTAEGDVSKSIADMVKVMGGTLPDAKDHTKKVLRGNG